MLFVLSHNYGCPKTTMKTTMKIKYTENVTARMPILASNKWHGRGQISQPNIKWGSIAANRGATIGLGVLSYHGKSLVFAELLFLP